MVGVWKKYIFVSLGYITVEKGLRYRQVKRGNG